MEAKFNSSKAEGDPRYSHDSLSSVSTTSLVFERLHERTEKDAENERAKKEYPGTLEDDDPLKDEDPDDLETGPFLGPGAALHRKPMDRSLRRILIIIGVIFVGGWLGGLAVFLVNGSYKHESDTEHDPDALSRGSGKPVTLDQIFQGFWYPKSHSISWVAGPDGEDGLLIEVGASGKDYMVVEDVRRNKDTMTTGDASTSIATGRTLMKDPIFEYGGKTYNPQWTGPSPDLKKVLIGINMEKNWRHSFTATYFIFDVETQTAEPLVPLNADAKVQLATWNAQSDAISFTQDNNLFIRRLTGKGDVTQITRDGGPEYFYGIPDWVYEEEVFSGRSATWWSEDGKYLAFLRTNETGVPEYPVQFFISRPSGIDPPEGEWAYPEVEQIKYPKAGAHNPVVDLQFYDLEKADVFSVSIDEGFEDDNRIINNLVWAGDKVIVKETNRVSDVLKVILIDVASREGKTVNTIDVDKLDGGWFEISHKMTYIPADPKNGRPEDGYVDSVIYEDHDHLAYFTPLDNPKPIMLTSGPWEVDDAPSAVDLANNLVYFIGTKESSIQRHVYSVKLDGTSLQPLTNTTTDGYYGASFSSGAGFVLLSYRGPKVPYQQVISTPSTRSVYNHILEDNAELADRAKKHALPILKYGTIDIGDGIELNYLERRPPHFNKKKKYPVLFQQYSGPGSQSVTKKFAVDFQAYVAASLGYLVITVDPRGTGFLGRKHRVVVRSQLGVLESHDHIAAAREFAKRDYVDAERLAIWGWSYGGFTTLKTLEQDAGQTFSYGMAVAPVTDWRFYDSIYTERYMRTPQENWDGYEASKVANATALGQNKRFLLMHGVADDNVHFQNSLTLLDDLDLAGVENYDVHVFPDSDHSIYFHNGNRIVYDKLRNWLINAFNGEWLKIADPQPYVDKKRDVEMVSV
ncbi:Fc.00g078330.m01.CDS01 [Cosmosporella sp. VM-42]